MSLETLLAAARYVESQDAQLLQHSTSPTRVRVLSDVPLSSNPIELANGSRYHELIISPDFQKRAAGTREVHNKLEKNRRAHLKECFELLKKQLPPSSEEKKSSNLSILQIAIRFIQTLRRKERDFEHEMERLAREKISHQQRLTALKRDLSAQWEHIDFDKLLPDSHLLHDDPRHRDNISHTTSTASEVEDMSDHDRGEPLSKCGVHYSSTSSLSSAATACSPPQLPQSAPVGALHHNPPPPAACPASKSVSIQAGGGGGRHVAAEGAAQKQVQLPLATHLMTSTNMAATLVSPTIQLLAPSSVRMVQGDSHPLGATTTYSYPRVVVAHRLRESSEIRTTASLTIPTLQLTNKAVGMPANGGIRSAKHPITITGVPNGLLGSAGSMTLTPISGHGLVSPVTVMSQGNQVAHILAPGGKVLKTVGLPSLVNGQYLVKPVTVVVSSSSALPQSS